MLVTGVFNSRERSSSIITLDSPSPPEAPASPVIDVTTTPQAVVAPYQPDPSPDPPPVENPEPSQQEETEDTKI